MPLRILLLCFGTSRIHVIIFFFVAWMRRLVWCGNGLEALKAIFEFIT